MAYVKPGFFGEPPFIPIFGLENCPINVDVRQINQVKDGKEVVVFEAQIHKYYIGNDAPIFGEHDGKRRSNEKTERSQDTPQPVTFTLSKG